MNKNIPIGTLITMYRPGYYILTRIQPRSGESDLYWGIKVANRQGDMVISKKETACDEYFCDIADIEEELESAKRKYDALKKYVTITEKMYRVYTTDVDGSERLLDTISATSLEKAVANAQRKLGHSFNISSVEEVK